MFEFVEFEAYLRPFGGRGFHCSISLGLKLSSLSKIGLQELRIRLEFRDLDEVACYIMMSDEGV